MIGRLHLLTPAPADAATLEATRSALSAGAPLVQVRQKDATDRDRLRFALAVRDACRHVGATCVVDDRCDVALAVGADGVHVGADDVPVAVARDLLGAGAVVGSTCRDADAARRAEAAGATYLGAGPVYRSSTKAGLPDPIGPEGLARIAAAVDIPVVAIGGVGAGHVAEVVAAGAHGVAVVAAVFAATDPARATTALLEALAAAGAPTERAS